VAEPRQVQAHTDSLQKSMTELRKQMTQLTPSSPKNSKRSCLSNNDPMFFGGLASLSTVAVASIGRCEIIAARTLIVHDIATTDHWHSFANFSTWSNESSHTLQAAQFNTADQHATLLKPDNISFACGCLSLPYCKVDRELNLHCICCTASHRTIRRCPIAHAPTH